MSHASHEARPADGGGFEASNVTVRFGGLVALRSVSLSVGPGEVRGVIGPNGAGKTTLFNVCCGFVRPQEGLLRWRGEDLGALEPDDLAPLGIARTLQGVGLFGGLSVVENVMIGAGAAPGAGRGGGFFSALLGLPASDRAERELRSRAMETLDELGAVDVAHRLPGTLPYPVQKQVALARALVARPELLLLDEPASGLSEGEMAELGETIRRLSGAMSIMLVEHHMDLVMSVCDQITVLDFGEVIADGSPDAVRTDPAVVAAYLGDEVERDGSDERADEPAVAPTDTAAVTSGTREV